jgi:hypothetical protein
VFHQGGRQLGRLPELIGQGSDAGSPVEIVENQPGVAVLVAQMEYVLAHLLDQGGGSWRKVGKFRVLRHSFFRSGRHIPRRLGRNILDLPYFCDDAGAFASERHFFHIKRIVL